jgi:hypothetical protein
VAGRIAAELTSALPRIRVPRDGYCLQEAPRGKERSMSNPSNDPALDRPEDAAEHETEREHGAPGVEVGSSDGEGSTFEPEEDPEGHAG